MGLEWGFPTAQQSRSPDLPDAGEGRLRRAGCPPPLYCIFSRAPLKLLPMSWVLSTGSAKTYWCT